MPLEVFPFSPDDKVPGFYGQVSYGAAGNTSGALQIALLLVGLATSAGTITPNTQVQQIFQDSDADTYAGAGSELACMAYDALQNDDDIPIFIMAPAAANGAVAAYGQLTIGGSWTGYTGTLGIRIAGQLVTYNVQSADSTTTVATNMAAAINGFDQGRLPVTATASGANVLLTCATAGVRGDQHIIFPVFTQLPTGMTATLTGSVWATGATSTLTTYVTPTVPNGYYYKVTTVGGTPTFASPQPTWPTTIGTATSADSNGNVFTCWGQVVNGGGITLGGGVGLETYTAALATLALQGYGRIAIACNDATSEAAWKTAIDSDAGPLIGYLQHVGFGMNTTPSLAISLAQTTVNDPRFQCLFYQSCETHPSRIAANMMADRAAAEVTDPDHSYDGHVLGTVAAQSQSADYPLHSQQVAMLNASVTALNTLSNQAVVVRSITTKSLTGGQPDYSVLDTGFAVVPDYVLMYCKGLWITYQQANQRLEPDPDVANGERLPPTGVATPSLWNSKVNAALLDMENANIPGAGVPPILYSVEDNPPQSALDPNTSGRLLTACPVFPAPGLHQLVLGVLEGSYTA